MNIYEKLFAIMEEAGRIDKDLTVNIGGGGYKATSHDEVAAAIRPLLLKYRVLAIINDLQDEQEGNMAKARIRVRFIDVDKPDSFVEVPGFGYGIDTQDKGPGKAISYAFKYVLLKTFFLMTRDDPERDFIDRSSSSTSTKVYPVQQQPVNTQETSSDDVNAEFSLLLEHAGGWEALKSIASSHDVHLPAGRPTDFGAALKKRIILKMKDWVYLK